MSWNKTEINTKYENTHVLSIPYPSIKYDNCDLMHFSYDHYDITPTLTLAQVQVQNNSCPC